MTAVAVLVGAGLAAVLTTSGAGTGQLLVDPSHASAPGFVLPGLLRPGRTVSLADLRGRDVVLNFWQSSCPPCQQEMPVLQAAGRTWRGRVTFVGIDTTDIRSAAVSSLRSGAAADTMLFDRNGTVADAYGVYGTPTTIFVSPGGRVLGRHLGPFSTVSLGAALRQAFGPAFGQERRP